MSLHRYQLGDIDSVSGMHKKSMEAAAHLEQVEKSSDISESDSEDGPSSRSSISANMGSLYHDDKVRASLSKLSATFQSPKLVTADRSP